MANLTKCLTSISPDLRSGPSPGRRLLAVALCAMLVLGSIFPGVALAGEVDSEGEGTAPTVEVPIPPDFDPGGEEEGGLEEVPAAGGGEEGGTVESESEGDPVPPADVTSAADEAPVEAQTPQPVTASEPTASAPGEPESVQKTAAEPTSAEPVANQSIVAPRPKSAERHSAPAGAAPSEAAPSSEPFAEDAPLAPPAQPATATADVPGHIAGRDSYVVRPGDCLWHIAAALLPAGVDTAEIEAKVERLWRLNEDRIGTGDPHLIYAGTTLRLR